MKKNNFKLHNYQLASKEIKVHYLLGSIFDLISIVGIDKHSHFKNFNGEICQLVVNVNNATLYINKEIKYSKDDYVFIYAICGVILGLNLYKKCASSKMNELAVLLYAINYVNEILNITTIPNDFIDYLKLENKISYKNEDSVLEQIKSLNLYEKLKSISMTKNNNFFVEINDKKQVYSYKISYEEIFINNIIEQAKKTIELSSKNKEFNQLKEDKSKLSYKVKKWFLLHFPLLAGIISEFKIIEDIKICKHYDIEIGAVSAINKEIYINPLAALNEEGMKFVIAHEILHIALNHASRKQERDHLLWNLACDFVINYWLIEMGVGVPPEGIFLDKDLYGKSADEIYLMLEQEESKRKLFGTLKNKNAGKLTKKTYSGCDMLDNNPTYFSDFEKACRESLLRGMFLEETIGRGNLPADLIEEIKAINQPPIPWQVKLAEWIAEKFPLEDKKRSYARPSRRQSISPDIPTAKYINPEEYKYNKVFGVIIDTSASMDKELLSKCLGAIISYCEAQEVKSIRLIYCDAQPYDEGYISIDSLMQKVKMKGRGGTVLQPAINILENDKNFPQNAPILILTDGYFESNLKVTREHAYLVPNKRNIINKDNAPIFEFR